MHIIFDITKRERTLAERGVDFADAEVLLSGRHFTIEDDRHDYGEVRFITAGLLQGRMIVMVWTPRGAARRTASLKKLLWGKPMSANKSSTGKGWVDPDDAPELTKAFFEHADEYQGTRLIRRGRPKAETVRERITIRLQPEVLEPFRASGPGWQTRMNAALADWLKTHNPSDLQPD